MRRIQNIALLSFLFLSSYCFAQTAVRVTYYDGTVQAFNVAVTGKLSFATDNLLIKPNETATVTTIPVSIIRKITLSDSLSASPLGVNLILFRASTSNCAVTINWESGTEENFSHYELQYGTDITSFGGSQKVYGKGSNSRYSVNLTDVKGKVYYRLKMVDKDGTSKYSAVISNGVSCAENNYAVYPNPGSGVIRITALTSDRLNVKS